jgi:hypothetical protein
MMRQCSFQFDSNNSSELLIGGWLILFAAGIPKSKAENICQFFKIPAFGIIDTMARFAVNPLSDLHRFFY